MPDETDNTILEDGTRKTYVIFDQKSSLNLGRIDPADATKIISNNYPTTYTYPYMTRTQNPSTKIWTDTFGSTETAYFMFRFPEEFLTSTKPRSIEVHHCRAQYMDKVSGDWKQTNDIMLHADFIKRDTSLDHTVMICNETRTKYKKYAYNSTDETFGIWFTFIGKPEIPFEFNFTDFVLELMLIY